MLTLRPGSLAYRLISMLSVTGEYPIHSLHLLGNPRVMRDLVRRMSEPQLVRLPGADSVQTKLVQISGKGAAKSVRLYRGALPILEWMHPDAFDYGCAAVIPRSCSRILPQSGSECRAAAPWSACCQPFPQR